MCRVSKKRVREVDQTKAAHTAHGTVPGPAPFVQRGRLPIKNIGFGGVSGPHRFCNISLHSPASPNLVLHVPRYFLPPVAHSTAEPRPEPRRVVLELAQTRPRQTGPSGPPRAPGGPVEGGLQEAHPGYSSRTSRAGGGRQLHEVIPEGVHAGCQEQRWRGQVDVSANRAGTPSSTMMPMSLKQKLMSAYRASPRLRHPTVAGRTFFQDKSWSKHIMSIMR